MALRLQVGGTGFLPRSRASARTRRLTAVRTLILLLLVASAVPCAEAPRLYSELSTVRRGYKLIWRNPGAVERVDFRFGIGGPRLQPRPPFRFLKEDTAGTNPKVHVRDAKGREWAVKFGPEASPDTFCTRLAWAVGYYAEPTYYVAQGAIRGARELKRARNFIDARGRFTGARFQLRSRYPEFLQGVDWGWEENPFLGTHALNGLKVMMMLVSNWDAKDIRDTRKHPDNTNTAIYREGNAYIFFVDDWGAAMGNWGHYFSRTKWDPVDYYHESARFVRGIKDGRIEWGFKGKHTGDLENGIHALPILPDGQRLWDGYLGTRVSFRCVILGVNEAQTLYDWSDVGTPVNIVP